MALQTVQIVGDSMACRRMSLRERVCTAHSSHCDRMIFCLLFVSIGSMVGTQAAYTLKYYLLLYANGFQGAERLLRVPFRASVTRIPLLCLAWSKPQTLVLKFTLPELRDGERCSLITFVIL